MAIPWGLAIFVIGILYGALVPGRQNKGTLFRQGLLIGVILGLVLALLGLLSGHPALGLAGFLGVLIEAVILSLFFILGVWLGDLLTGARRVTH